MGEWGEFEEKRLNDAKAGQHFDLAGDPPTIRNDRYFPSREDYRLTELPPDIAFLEGAGISRERLGEVATIGRRKGIAASEVLIDRDIIGRQEYIELLAKATGSGVLVKEVEPGQILIPCAGHGLPTGAGLFRFPNALHFRDGEDLHLLVSAENFDAVRLAGIFMRKPDGARKALLTTDAKLRRMWFDALRDRMSNQACNYLAAHHRAFSAKWRITPIQGAFLVAMAVLFGVAATLHPGDTVMLATILFSGFYFASILLRSYFISRLDTVSSGNEDEYLQTDHDPEDYPLYSIIVALFQEVGQTDTLIDALDRLDWPKTKREVFLVCEADDAPTINAIKDRELPQGFNLILCPKSEPRTKPKALNFVLALCAGQFTVIYDAEDRPDPGQLREAWSKFARSGPDLACLQAPLLIHNRNQTWLTAMFALEYETLFLGMLPILSQAGSPLPLGGTSNHFRTSALKSAGGWDPHNVTEDADLGIRLFRMGYCCGTIGKPTWEEAPPFLPVWTRQRSRWLKGWLQTMLVHLRNPVRTAHELGWKGNIIFHFMLTSIVISILIHPIFIIQLLLLILYISCGQSLQPYEQVMFGISAFNLTGGYTTYCFLAYGVIQRNCYCRSSPRLLRGLPIYWLLISAAGWRAVGKLITDPFHWEKTTHGLAIHHVKDNMQ